MNTPVFQRVDAETPSLNLMFFCPGCRMLHGVRDGVGGWTFNGDMVRPTVSPSVLVRGVEPMTDAEHSAWMADRTKLPSPRRFVCHSFITAGQIQFLGDCTHALAGQTVPLPPIDQ